MVLSRYQLHANIVVAPVCINYERTTPDETYAVNVETLKRTFIAE
jgi:hypothetical protein